MALPQVHCHDLLARVIFAQFLFDRKDSDGTAFFSPAKMRRLHEDGTLSKVHNNLASVFSQKTDTYALFRWMDDRFNGDLFPGKDGDDEDARENAWRAERNAVAKEHLDLLAKLIRGDLVAGDNQPLLWRFYSFDTIPLEFISSVYKEFLTAEERGNDKAYYTPAYLVDYVLDAVLPWNNEDWNVRILDPCCGSGIFLVKAFQRIIHRWRLAHKREPLVSDLRPLLENNFVGVDKNPEAVRVACFSLYLAMADAIEPKHYVTHENYKVFPHLRGTRLIHQDFFDDETQEIRTTADKESFNYILGNAPWGDGSIEVDPLSDNVRISYAKRAFGIKATKATRTRAQIWAKANGWPVANNDIGPLFLAKAAALVKPDGFVAMVNNAQMLYRRDGLASHFRLKLFSSCTFDEVTNLTAVRRDLFSQAVGPACIVVFKTAKPEKQRLLHYYTPKPTRSTAPRRGAWQPTQGFSIEPYDLNVLTHEDAASNPDTWVSMSMGGNRDRLLILRLKSFSTIDSLSNSGEVICRSGIIPGDRKQKLDAFKDVPFFGASDFLPATFLTLKASSYPPWNEPLAATTYATNPEAFKSPQLLVKVTPMARTGRFRAVRVLSGKHPWGVVCTKSFLTVRDFSPTGVNVDRACIAYNSNIAAYFLHLTSGRSLYNTEVLLRDLRSVPVPAAPVDLVGIRSFKQIDEIARNAFGLTSADLALVEDFLEYTLPDILRKAPGPARFQTQRKAKDGTSEPELTQYAKTFARVLKGTFGKGRAVGSTIYTERDSNELPVRMITVHLDSPLHDSVTSEPINKDGLLDELAKFRSDLLQQKTRNPIGSGLGFQRVAYLFQPGREGKKHWMNLTIFKPDECRYWTRSMAMRDADQLAIAIRKAAPPRKTPA